MQNYKLILSYDGTDFYGWQRQSKKRTVQGTAEDSLAKITQKKIHITGAGRTDAGVHARAQAANFKANLNMDDDELFRALNSLLPQDVRVTSLERTDLGFHARKMAKSKVYQYRIFNSLNINPFIIRYVLHWTSPLKVQSMREAAPLFIREADFTAFSSNRLLDPVRKVTRSELHKKGDEIIYTVEANGFLRYMVRTMVGTLLEVGKGKLLPEQIEELFKKKERSLASPTAPAKGLSLLKVNY
ncbi:MAG: tRNA pseudouridine(38-40) synthase TruA [Candidatus Aminicenantes bacterium]|nr:MAG: tRNA pseudouridine(38-40) synthase TruA [Candidatus Aminicenantes bacterium]